MQKINLLYIVSSIKSCGPLNVMFNIIKHLDKDRFNISILELTTSNDIEFKNKLIKSQCKISSLNNSRVKGIFENKKQVYQYIINNKIDIVHCHGYRPDIIISSLKNKIQCKTITTIHNRMDEDYSTRYGKVLGKVFAEKHINAIKKVNVPISCSDSVKNYIKYKFNVDTLSIPNGVDNTIYKYSENKSSIKEKLNVSKGRKIMVFTGGLGDVKNPILAIKGFLEANNANLMLIFLGDGELKDQAENLIEESNISNIVLKGRVDNVQDYLQIADCFISTSKSEGMPNAVLEAMAVGVPCILSDIDSHKEIAKNKGDVYTFKNNSVEDLAKKINELDDLQIKTPSLGNIDIINKKYSSEVMANKYQNIYLERL